MHATLTQPPAAQTSLDFVSQLAKAKPAKASKSSTRFGADLPALEPHIGRWIEAKAERDKYASIMETSEAQIIEAGLPLLLDSCARERRVETSIRLNNRVTLTRKNQYSKIPDEHIGALRETFTQDYPRYFAEQLNVSLTLEAAADEKFLSILVAALGPDEFAARFNVTRTVTPTEAFHVDYTVMPQVRAESQPFIESEVIKPYKPSLKI
jgi:hypothetical protein